MYNLRVSLIILILSTFIACDNGGFYPASAAESTTKIKVTIERQIRGQENTSLVVFAQGFKRESDGNGQPDLITFQCPCILSENLGGFSGAGGVVYSESELVFKTLPGADYSTIITNLGNPEK